MVDDDVVVRIELLVLLLVLLTVEFVGCEY